MLYKSGRLNLLQRLAWFSNQSLLLYGDHTLPIPVHLQAAYGQGNLTRGQMNRNKAMSEVRAIVEWLFGEIKT